MWQWRARLSHLLSALAEAALSCRLITLPDREMQLHLVRMLTGATGLPSEEQQDGAGPENSSGSGQGCHSTSGEAGPPPLPGPLASAGTYKHLDGLQGKCRSTRRPTWKG